MQFHWNFPVQESMNISGWQVKSFFYVRRLLREEGRKEGIIVLQKTLIKLAKRKLGTMSSELEKQILENTSIPQLENALENIFDFNNEEALLNVLKQS